jgi:hypothetical protein
MALEAKVFRIDDMQKSIFYAFSPVIFTYSDFGFTP